MRKIVRRGFVESDSKDFNGKRLETLIKAAEDCSYLINRNYKIKNASIFIANNYQLSERQRFSLARSISKEEDILIRKNKEKQTVKGKIVNIDGFNAIIPIETALSGSLILECMDGTIRDLADLKGTYNLIDKTEPAVILIIDELLNLGVKKANFYFDKPISNSGRLSSLVLDIANKKGLNVEVFLLDHVDEFLYDKENVISGDSVILNKCISWINFYKLIINNIPNVWKIKLL